MALKIKLARPAKNGSASGHLFRLALQILLVCIVLGFVLGASFYAYYYYKYKQIVDERLQHPLFTNTAKIYAAPREIRVGQKLSARFVVDELRQAGYSADMSTSSSPMGIYRVESSGVYVRPGPLSYHAQDGATISFADGAVGQISGDSGQQLAAYELEPQLITGLSDTNRTKRRLVKYDELPPILVKAVTSIEDRRFFSHGGVDYYSMMGWVWHDLRGDRRWAGGGSTVTMQLARGIFLSPEKKLKRKFIEIVITFQLESRFSKQQIFEMYANQINLGQQGSFAINGFGEAAQVYFGKDVRQLDLAQCALLAGMIQQPSYRNPYRHPERSIERRNVVLDAMLATGSITHEEAQRAKAEPLKLASQSVDAGEAPYFVDLVRDQLNQKIGERDFNREGLRIYTSLDPDLERAASDAVDVGMKIVDEQVRKKLAARRATNADPGSAVNVTYPQVAMVALNPHTGQVLALVGGRNYGQSQLNHATSKRPTGSIFKPFVYAAAFNSAIAGAPLPGQDAVFSPVTMLSDEQATYNVGNQEYRPRNYHGDYHDQVTARYALQHSLNNATIALAQMVGFDNVAALARQAGIKSARGTPAVALGAYDATPLDMAGAYTVFANGGIKIDPWMVASVRSPDGNVLNEYAPDSKPLLDPRVAYLTTNLMENVINAGSGNEVRRRGFTPPAAGKTGTSNDAWFAGYTSNLLCVVWVGNDDYTDIKMEGAHAAAPIWAEFMKRAVELPQYSDTRAFTPPAGIIEVRIDKVTNLLTDSTCPDGYNVAFLDGTAPTDTCDHANGDQRNLFQKLFGLGDKPADGSVPPGTPTPVQPSGDPALAEPATAATNDPNGQTTKKKGFFGKVFGVFKSDDKPKAPPPPKSQP